MNRPRLLLADDHPETRALLSCLLDTEFDVVGSVGNGLALVESAEELLPDVIVTDISMPVLDGIAATAVILRTQPGIPIILVSVHSDPSLVRRGIAAGALGYVLKLAAGEELLAAVRAALMGQFHVSQGISFGSGALVGRT
jgi:DNA-binding NarL/FixJ family response regulator